MECKHNDIVTDNYGKQYRICLFRESEYFLKPVSTAFGHCCFGEIETESEGADDE
jgi:hypothetical protein